MKVVVGASDVRFSHTWDCDFFAHRFCQSIPEMKICPTTFGPYFWSVIHMTALSATENLTPERKEAYVRFFETMPDILPCTMCGKHLRENLQVLPVDTDDMFRWSIDLHNLVNTQLNKPEMPYDQAYRYWSSRCARGAEKDRSMIIMGVVVAIVLIGLLTLLK
jgi:hypothetical protein